MGDLWESLLKIFVTSPTTFPSTAVSILAQATKNFLLSIFFFTVNGSWSQWSNWSLCPESCNHGSQSRSRVCQNLVSGQGYVFRGCEGAYQEGEMEIESRECLVTTCSEL